jgi:phosphate starvation-inducible PhoH-like protein
MDPLGFYGAGNTRQDRMQAAFPELKMTLRGSRLLLEGNDQVMNRFQVLWERLLRQCSLANGFLSDDAFNEAMAGLESRQRTETTGFETTSKTVLVHGPNGLIVRARTPNQQRMVDAMERCDLLFALGPAGSGKTYTAVALAVRSLKNKEVRKIILTRPAVEAGESLG